MVISFIVLAQVALLVSVILSRDYISSATYYCFCLITYFLGIYQVGLREEIYIVYLLFILLGLFFFIFQRYKKSIVNIKNNSSHEIKLKKLSAFVCLLSLPSVIFELNLIQSYGGFFAYISNISNRVVDFEGRGYIIIFRRLLPLLNIYFFLALVLSKNKPSFSIKSIYVLHLFTTISLALLSGSRGSLFSVFLSIIIILSIYRYKFKMMQLASLAAIFLFMIALLGQVRGGTFNDFDDITNSLDRVNVRESKVFNYGLIPLQQYFLIEDYELNMGTTFIASITNFIPRSIWPDKYDSGGVELTKLISGKYYYRSSHFSPGLFVESLLAFGSIVGPIVFLIIMLASFYVVHMIRIRLYSRQSRSFIEEYQLVYIYILFFIVPGGFLFGEFASMVSSIIMKIFLMIMIVNLYKIFVGDIRQC